MGLGLVYAVLLALVSLTVHHGDLLYFARVSPRFQSGDTSASLGYDGQFAYYIASNPSDAISHLDEPAYRLQRILYPTLARVLALGQMELVPLGLVLVNVIALTLGTGAFAELLRREGAPSWTPLLFFAWFGVGHALLYDLNEITALAFALWGLVFFFRDQMLIAGLLFGLGALSKDMAFLFAVPTALVVAIMRRWMSLLQLSLLSFAPYLLWLLILLATVGKWSFDAGPRTQFELIPLAGLYASGPVLPFVLGLLILPGALCVFWALRSLDQLYAVAVIFSFSFIVFLPPPSFMADAVFRLSTPLALSSALLLARLRRRKTLAICAGMWSATAMLSWAVALWA
jgi:hypothetical protein